MMKGRITIEECLKLHSEGIAVILLDGKVQGFENERITAGKKRRRKRK